MYLILTTIVLMVLLRWAATWYSRSKGQPGFHGSGERPSFSEGDLSLWQALCQELLAWLLVVGLLGALVLLAFVYASFFGSIRPIHEWGT